MITAWCLLFSSSKSVPMQSPDPYGNWSGITGSSQNAWSVGNVRHLRTMDSIYAEITSHLTKFWALPVDCSILRWPWCRGSKSSGWREGGITNLDSYIRRSYTTVKGPSVARNQDLGLFGSREGASQLQIKNSCVQQMYPQNLPLLPQRLSLQP